LSNLPAAVGFDPVVVASVGSEVADSDLAGRSAALWAEVGDGVVDVDFAGDGAEFFDSGYPATGGKCFLAEVDIEDSSGPGLLRVEWRWAQLE
jgi:hypothetical protein